MNLLRGSDDGRARNGGDDWVCAMRAGQFEQAWAITDRDLAQCRWGNVDKHLGPRHLQRIWRGEELQYRTVLVRCYHGLGDTIQFARFLTPLAERVRTLTVWCQPELIPLIERIEGVDRAIPLHDGTPEADFEVDIEIMEIPHALRAGRDLIELRRPYLTLPPRQRPECIGKQQALAVGLVWEVGNWDKRRAIPTPLLGGLKCEGLQLYSLQRGVAPEAPAQLGAKDISTPDIVELGHRLSELDVVLSVDTMVVHLAGALGCEPWVMLQKDCDWRWPADGGPSIWYPRAKLFYQRGSGDWAYVINSVSSALAERAWRRIAGLSALSAVADIPTCRFSGK
jgi:hypothetical protein